jgi:hypothetical protein
MHGWTNLGVFTPHASAGHGTGTFTVATFHDLKPWRRRVTLTVAP